MSNTLLKLLALAAFAGAMPGLAQAQDTVDAVRSPVAITSFHINERYVPGTVGSDLERPPQLVAGDVSITFRNTANVGATVVKFSVDDGGSAQVIVDKGTFRPGVTIKHDFAPADESVEGENAKCL